MSRHGIRGRRSEVGDRRSEIGDRRSEVSPASGRDQGEGERSQRSEFDQDKSNAALMIAEKLRATADRMHEVGKNMIHYRQAPYYERGMEMTNAAAMAHAWAREIEEENNA